MSLNRPDYSMFGSATDRRSSTVNLPSPRQLSTTNDATLPPDPVLDSTYYPPQQAAFMSTGSPSITFPQIHGVNSTSINYNNAVSMSQNKRTQSFSYFGTSANSQSYYHTAKPVNPKGRINGYVALSLWQTWALIWKIFQQKFRSYVVTLAEILIPVVFIAVFSIIWAISGNPTKPERDYYTTSDLTSVRVPSALESLTCNNITYYPGIPMVDGYQLCINTAWRVNAQNVLGIPVQNGILFTASFGNPPPTEPIPRGSYPLTLPSGWRPFLNAYLYEFESEKIVDDSGTLLASRGSGGSQNGEKGAQPFVIKSLDEHALMMLLGAVGEINDDVTNERTVLSGVSVRYKLYFSPNTPTTTAFIAFLNSTSKLSKLIYGGVFPTLQDAMDASAGPENSRRSWAIIDILEMSRDRLDFGVYVNRTTIPDTTNNVYETYAGGYPDNYKPELYVTSGYLTLQRLVYEYYITRILQAGGATLRSGDGRDGTTTTAPSVPRQFLYMPMGHPSYEDVSFLEGAGEYAPLMIALAFLFPVSQLTKTLVVEKESKLRETLFIMGLGRITYHISWILVYYLQFLISAALCTLLLHYTFLPRSNAGLIFLMLATYALSAIAFSGLFAALFSNSKAAAFVAPLVFLIFACPFFLFQSGVSHAIEVVFSFLSPSAIGNAFLRIIEYEFSSGMHAYEFTHNPTTKTSTRLTVFGIWWFLMLDTFIYFLLMIYFDLVLPSAIGTPYHPLFFILQPIKHYKKWSNHRRYVQEKKRKAKESETSPDGIIRRVQPTDSVIIDGDVKDTLDQYDDEEDSPTLSRKKKRELAYDGRDPNGFFENDDFNASNLGTSTIGSSHVRERSRVGEDPNDASNVTAPFIVENVRAGAPPPSTRHQRESSTSQNRRVSLPMQSTRNENSVRDSRTQLTLLRRQSSISLNSVNEISGLGNQSANQQSHFPSSPTSRRNYDLTHVKVRGLVKEFERNGGKKFFKKNIAKEEATEKSEEDANSANDGKVKPETAESIAAREARLREENLFRAVDGLRLDFGIGEINVLLGHNGAGKTTTINLMCGMLKPTAGDCFIFGHSITHSPQKARREIGICPQHNILYPDLTCEQHLKLFARIKGYHGKALTKRVDEMLESVGLEEKKHYLSTQLSGGQKRKLSIAMAFVGDAKLVFLDEPTAGVDVTARRTIWDFIKKESADRSVILTTHYMDEADLLGDKIAIMNGGRLKCRGSSLFLKSRLGVGYTLSMSLSRSLHHRHNSVIGRDAANAAPSQPLSSVDLGVIICDRITDQIPDCEIASFVPGELVMRLPLHDIALFPKLLEDLETHSKQLGIRGMSMALTTLEDVFMRITNDEVPPPPPPASQPPKQPNAGGEGAINAKNNGDGNPTQNMAETATQKGEDEDFASPASPPNMMSPIILPYASTQNNTEKGKENTQVFDPNDDPSLCSASKHVQFDPRPPTSTSPPTHMSPYPSPDDVQSLTNRRSPSPPPTVTATAINRPDNHQRDDPLDVPLGSHPGDASGDPIGTLFDVQPIISPRATPRGTANNTQSSQKETGGTPSLSPSMSASYQPDRKQGESLTSLTSPSERNNLINRQKLMGGNRIRKFRSTSTQPVRSGNASANVSSSAPHGGGTQSVASGESGGYLGAASMATNHPSRITSPNLTDAERGPSRRSETPVPSTDKVRGWDTSPNPNEEGGIMSTDTLYLDPLTSLTSLDRAMVAQPAQPQTDVPMEDQDEIDTLAVWRARKTGIRQAKAPDGTPEIKPAVEKPDLTFFGNTKKHAQQMFALLKKRWLNLKRDKKTIVLQIIFPVLCVLASMLLRLIAYPSSNTLVVSDESSIYGSPSEFLYDDTCRGGLLSFQVPPGSAEYGDNGINRYGTFSPALSAAAMSQQLKNEFNSHPDTLRYHSFFCEDVPMRNRLSSPYISALPASVVTMFSNYTSIHQPAIALSSFYKKMINRYVAATPNPETGSNFIEVTNRLGVLPASTYEEQFHNAKNVGFAAIIIILPFILIPSTFIAWIVKEKQCKSRHLQTIAGLTFGTYWVANFLFDLLCMIVTSALVIAVFFMFSSDEYVGIWEPLVTTILLFILFGISSILIAYVMSFAFEDASVAQNVSLLVNFVCGFLLVLAIFIMNLIKESKPYAKYVKWVFRISPAYCLGESISTLATDGVLRTVTGNTARPLSLESCGWPLIYMGAESLIFIGLLIFIDHPRMRARRRQKALEAERKKRHEADPTLQSPLTITTNPSGVNSPPKKRKKFVSPHDIRDRDQLNDSISSEDSDVRAERQEIESGARNATDSIIVRGLTKTYPNGTRAVRGLSFGVRKGEILALLGVNGAGKTTTMSMICQDIDPTSGTIAINGCEVADNVSETLHAVGYCPQFDALIDTLTPQEHLELFAGIRGIYRKDLPDVVERLMHVIGLTQYKDVLAGKLSGGNKRKLSVAMALLGGPDVILFDEPSAGMDPLARRTLWKVIEIVTQYCSVILTTHHLEEVEALADRVGIMAKGEMKCIGDKTALKNKFGSGFEVSVRLIEQKSSKHLKAKDRYAMDNAATDLKNLVALEEGKMNKNGKTISNHDRLRHKVRGAFPTATYQKLPFHSATILFPKNTTSLSQIFTFMESVKTETGIREYAVSQASIESIFMDINKQIEDAEGDDEKDKKQDAD